MSEMQIWINIGSPILGAAVAILVPLITFRYNAKLREMEAKEREKDRKFEVTRQVSLQAIEVLGKSYHLAHEINWALNDFRNADESLKIEVVKKVNEARYYWEKNFFFLPEVVRREIIGLTNMSYQSFRSDKIGMLAFQKALHKVSTLFDNITKAFEDIMSDYNLFESFGSGRKSP